MIILYIVSGSSSSSTPPRTEVNEDRYALVIKSRENLWKMKVITSI